MSTTMAVKTRRVIIKLLLMSRAFQRAAAVSCRKAIGCLPVQMIEDYNTVSVEIKVVGTCSLKNLSREYACNHPIIK